LQNGQNVEILYKIRTSGHCHWHYPTH